MGGRDDWRTGVETSGFLTLGVSPEFYMEERIGKRQGGPERKERHRKGETKWIRIKDRREEWKRETSKLLRENGVWYKRERERKR